MAENCKEFVLTVKQQLELTERFENRELATISQRLWDRD
jgi:hypothetical protein